MASVPAGEARAAGDARTTVRPFLKWAGGKRQLLPALREWYPSTFAGYFEPFLGSGAVFFDLCRAGRLDGHAVTLGDRNADLIGCYRMVRDRVGEVIAALGDLATRHRLTPDAEFYAVRDRFNAARRRLKDEGGPLDEAYTPELAAMLVYLNRTAFNGLFRLNADGDFNVPIGRYKNPRICDAAALTAAADALARPNVALVHGTFADLVAGAGPHDFLYFDPPYAPLSATSAFTRYTAAGFTSADQSRLQSLVIALAGRGCHILLSNSTAPEIARLYDDNPEARRAGLRSLKVPARRAINSNPESRGAVLEYVITNTAQAESPPPEARARDAQPG